MRLVLLSAVLAINIAAAQEKPKLEQVYRHPKLEVVLPDFPAEGLILDIGGGGEGVIGQLKGSEVVAIDLIKRELEEAPDGPLLKIVMDARDLKFLDRSFATATVFFTFMYIAPEDQEKVFTEIHRVLKPGGRLLVWDVIFPQKKPDERQLYIVYPLHVKLTNTEINTGYGVKIQEGRGAANLAALAFKAGFQLSSQKEEQGWFSLEFKK